MPVHVLEKLVATNTASEVWWDSSPLVYETWRQATLAQAQQTKRADWQAQLARLFDPSRAAAGEMGFGGVTTNPTAIDSEADAALIARLRQLPYFRQAYDFDGMAAAEFSHFAAFATTATEFAAATRKTVDFVARAMEGRQTRVA